MKVTVLGRLMEERRRERGSQDQEEQGSGGRVVEKITENVGGEKGCGGEREFAITSGGER